MSVRVLTALCTLALVGCTGEIVGLMDPPKQDPTVLPDGGTRPAWFTCADDQQPSSEVVLRLTPVQYRNVLEDLLGRGVPAAQLQTLFAGALAPSFNAIPTDGSGHRSTVIYDSMDQRISPLLVAPQFEIATRTGEWIAADLARLTAFVAAFTPCVDTSTCVDDFIDGFGRRALRRHLDDEDRTTYRGMYDDSEYGGYAALIAGFLLSPDFMFRTEFHGDAVDSRSDLTRLTPDELANRIAFAATNSMPDDALFAAADQSFIGAGNTLGEQVDRLQTTPRARTQYENFFKQWLRLDRIPGFNPSATAVLDVLEPGTALSPLAEDTDLTALRQSAFDEMVELMTHTAAHGGLRDALMSDVSYARSPVLAQIYGVQPWDGDDAHAVKFPAGQRAGLFTRAGYLFSGFPDTNPVIRGARLRVEYLCDQMEPPANTTPPDSYVVPEVPTVRNVVTAKTEIPGTACQGCHTVSLNPLGFPFEDFDAFGRARQQQALFDGQGAVSRWLPVEASAKPDVDRVADQTSVTGGVATSALLADSQRLHACFARHTFRYVTGRTETLTANEDACTLNGMERAAGTSSINDVLLSLTRSKAFALRRMPEGN